MARLFNLDPATGTVERFHWRPSTEEFVIEDRQNVDAILDQNHALKTSDARHKRSSLMRRVAAIPLNIYYDLLARGIKPGTAAFDKWLDDPDNRAWRTDNAKIHSKTKHYRD